MGAGGWYRKNWYGEAGFISVVGGLRLSRIVIGSSREVNWSMRSTGQSRFLAEPFIRVRNGHVL